MIQIKRRTVILISALLASNVDSFSQDTAGADMMHGNGITLSAGVSYIAVRDEYLSPEKYTATLPIWGVAWSRFSTTFAYRLTFQYQSTTHLKSYNVSADLHQGSVRLDILFPIGDFELMNRKASAWLGPGSEFFAHTRRQRIAGDVKESSTFSSIYGNVVGQLFYPLASSLNVEAVSSFSLFSLAAKTNVETGSESTTKLQSLFTSLRAEGEIRLRHRFIGSLSAFAGYRFELTRATAWDFFIAGNDQLLLAITYDL
jgi:hypothetical protein